MNVQEYKNCQSCGMNIRRNPESKGTNKDGSRSGKYCRYCYQNGEFTFKGSYQEMQNFCQDQMVKSGSPKWLAWVYTRAIPKLERWN